jgi:hypothetical protein
MSFYSCLPIVVRLSRLHTYRSANVEMPMSTTERRRLERFKLSTPARLTVQAGTPGRLCLELTTKDISSGGAYLYSGHRLGAGAQVSMELLISLANLSRIVGSFGRAKINVRGTVVRVDERGMAIRFERRYLFEPLGSCDADRGLPTGRR